MTRSAAKHAPVSTLQAESGQSAASLQPTHSWVAASQTGVVSVQRALFSGVQTTH